MEKYVEIIKAMAECAGPDCGLTCPYKDKSAGGKSCRALLLEDAMQAIVGEEARADAAEADRDGLKEYALALEKEGQEARKELDAERLANSDLEGKVNDLEAVNKVTEAERDKALEHIRELDGDINNLYDAREELRNRINALRTERDKLNQDYTLIIQQRDALAADKNAIREQNKELRVQLEKMTGERDELHKECEMTVTRCQVLQGEINALVLKMGKQEGKTDRTSVCNEELVERVGELIAQANYQQGRADTLAEIVARCSFGGGGHHD